MKKNRKHQMQICRQILSYCNILIYHMISYRDAHIFNQLNQIKLRNFTLCIRNRFELLEGHKSTLSKPSICN